MWIRMIAMAAVVLSACPLAVAQDEPAQPPAEMKTLAEKASYIIGFDIGSNIKSQDLGLDVALLVKGLSEALDGKDARLTEEEIAEVMQAFQQQVIAAQEAKMKAEADKNLADGAAFLKANALKEGVKVLESGLQYKVVKNGEGPSPKVTDTIRANYRGTFIDGKEFDASPEGQPIEIPVGGVIRGWVEALQKMKVGDKWMLYIPSDLAYGPQGPPGIGPNQTLVFEVELVEIVAPQ